jgi:ankyrin repeat protein|eukprot:COSAG01_NODE_30638_length_612_cov_0.902534_1_plen_72_part_00
METPGQAGANDGREAARVLLAAGAHHDAEDHDGDSAFSAATARGYADTAALIAHFALARGLHQQRERGEVR